MKQNTAKHTEDVSLNSFGNTFNICSTTTSRIENSMLEDMSFSDHDYEVKSDDLQPAHELGDSRDEVEYKNIQQLLYHYFGASGQLQNVFILEREQDTQVWIIIPNDDDSFRESIYEVQYSILNGHPYLRLDFYVVSFKPENLKSIIPTNALRLAVEETIHCRQ